MFKNTIHTIKWLYCNMIGYRLSVLVLTVLLTITSLINIAIAILSKQLVDAATLGDRSYVYGLFFIFIIVVLSEIMIDFVNRFLNIYIWQNLSIRTRLGLFKALVNASWLDFNKIHSGDYVSRFTQDCAVVISGLVDDIPHLLSSAVKFVAAFCVLLYYQPMIALFTFLFGPIVLFVSRFYSKRLKQAYQSIQELDSEVNGRLQEYFHNIQIVKSYGLEEIFRGELEAIYLARKKLILRNSRRSNTIGIVKSVGMWGGYMLAYGIGIFGLYNEELSFGVLVLFLQLFNQVQEPLSEIAGSIPKLTALLVSAERIIEIQKLKQDEITTYLAPPSKLLIKLVNVNFAYPNTEELLKNINFIARSGEIVLLLGRSGAGKTTLIRLILSLLYPNSGEIIFVDDLSNSYTANPGNRQWISYVPQGYSLFSGTIASNICYGNPDATEDEMIAALRAAEALDFVRGMKAGIHSFIGEGGTGLSAGQAQRLAIARALIHKAPGVIFDEVTSSLDPETERRVMENVRRDFQAKTFIVITHRDAVKAYADRIYRLCNGTIIQE